MANFLNYNDAVQLTYRLMNFFNSEASDHILLKLANHFDMPFKENFTMFVNEIEMNCRECAGCHDGKCVLGCLIEHRNTFKMCFWDEALEQVVGTKLVIHEFGHLIFSQVFNYRGRNFDKASEEFAQFMEDHFETDLQFYDNVILTPKNDQFNNQATEEVTRGVEFGLGIGLVTSLFALGGIFVKKIFKF